MRELSKEEKEEVLLELLNKLKSITYLKDIKIEFVENDCIYVDHALYSFKIDIYPIFNLLFFENYGIIWKSHVGFYIELIDEDFFIEKIDSIEKEISEKSSNKYFCHCLLNQIKYYEKLKKNWRFKITDNSWVLK